MCIHVGAQGVNVNCIKTADDAKTCPVRANPAKQPRAVLR